MHKRALSQKNITLLLVKLLVVCTCIQHMVFNYMLGGKAGLRFSKELVLFLLLFALLPRFARKLKIDVLPLAAFLGFLVCLCVSSLLFSNVGAMVYSARKFVLPVFLCFVLRITGFFEDIEQRNKLFRFIIDLFVVLSLWGIFQVIVLKDTFLMNLGYDTVFGHLDYTFYFNNFYFLQRNCSTFASPNIFACLLCVVIVILLGMGEELYSEKNSRDLRFIILAGSLLLTFSRGSILSLVIVYLVFFTNLKKIAKSAAKYIIGAAILGVLAIVAINVVMKIDIIATVIDWISKTLSGGESSSAARTSIWAQAFMELMANPMGIGAGKAGINAGTEFAETFACENSYLLLGLESGLVGLAFYLIFMLSFLYKSRYNSKRIKELLAFLMINFMFSNHVQDVEVMMAALLFLTGLQASDKLRVVSWKENA